MTSELPFEEPQELGLEDPPEQAPPGKLEYYAAVYGWMKHVHLEVEASLERMKHIDLSFDEALRELALYVPESVREAAVVRATTRRDAMVTHPLPPFPAAVDSLGASADQPVPGPVSDTFGTEEHTDRGYTP